MTADGDFEGRLKANGGEAVVVDVGPDGSATVDVGIPDYGDYAIESAMGVPPDGADAVDLTAELDESHLGTVKVGGQETCTGG